MTSLLFAGVISYNTYSGKIEICWQPHPQVISGSPYHRLYYCYKFLFLVYYGVKKSVVVVLVF